MQKRISIVSLCLVAILVTSNFCLGQTISAKIDSIVQKYDTLGGYNGIIIVALGTDSIFTFEYGYKDPTAKAEKISLTDRFDIASVSKQFTSLAILELIDKGLIQQDDTIGKFFPELKPNLQKVTIRQLANHTNGIHDFYSLTTRHDTVNKQEAMAMLSKLDTTVFTPGSKWGYSNSGYLLLSEIVERVTKMRFQEYTEKNVLLPLGMTSACYLPECNEKLHGYDENLKPVIFNAFSSGEAGMYATGNDMIAYYRTVSKNPQKWHKYFSLSYELSDASNAENWNYGFGWFFTKDSLGQFRAHSGRNWGAHAYIRWYDKRNIFLCLLSNKKNDDLFKELREDISKQLVDLCK